MFKFKGAFNADSDIAVMLNQICLKYSSEKKYDRAIRLIDEIDKYFKPEFYLVQEKGNVLFFSGEKNEGINLAYKAYGMYEKTGKDKIKAVIIPLPVKGVYLVGGNSQRTTITHAGLNRYCFDFIGATEDGAVKKDGTGNLGKSNDEYTGFGVPVYSPADGVVVDLIDDIPDKLPANDISPDDGNYICIRGNDGLIYFFVHNRQHSAKVKKGDIIRAGQIIALIGNSGMTTILHLHFAVYNLHFAVYTPDFMVTVPVVFKDYYLLKKDGSSVRINEGTPDDKDLIKTK